MLSRLRQAEELKVREGDKQAGGAPRFRAFLSYSHADACAARRLHRRLETYRLPRRLRQGIVPSCCALSGRLGPIFRDREDFPAAQDLSHAVKQALAESDKLIVLCSPDAALSSWVAQEIALFRQLHPGRPILCALIRGEPADSFPSVLNSGAEPLAADLRREGDGARLGLLKIVAGLAEVPLDALIQRDAQRRQRRVTAITLAACLGVLVMSGITMLAVTARNEAERQRSEAEGLIEFMLTDLRSRLKSVGRLDVMTSVNERAMSYYESQGDLSHMPDASLERRARILTAMGEDDDKRGEIDAALEKIGEAHRTTKAILARRPDDPQAIFAHAQSEYWLGYLAYVRQQRLEARNRFSAYKRLADQLVKADPRNPGWLREAGYAEGNLCSVMLQKPQEPKAALQHCRSALHQMQAVARLLPGNGAAILDVANRHAWLSDAWKANGNWQAALFHRAEQERLLRPLVEADPHNADLREFWMLTQMTYAELLSLRNRTADARPHLAEASAYATQLMRRDPENEKWSAWRRRVATLEESLDQGEMR